MDYEKLKQVHEHVLEIKGVCEFIFSKDTIYDLLNYEPDDGASHRQESFKKIEGLITNLQELIK